MPKPHVSFNISKVQNAHHPIMIRTIMFAKFSKRVSFKSITAIAIKTISNISFTNDTGIAGSNLSFARNIIK